MIIPTTQECVDSSLAIIESKLGVTVPEYDKAFLRVVAVALGMTKADLYKFGVQRHKQVLALTATGEDLTELGAEYSVIRKAEQKCILNIAVMAAVGTPINRSVVFQSEENGMYYFPIQDFVATAGVTLIQVRAEFAGPLGKLAVGSVLYTVSEYDGIGNGAPVSSVDTEGSYEETDEELRSRILDEIQTVGGGSNLADYRTWGQQTPNVYRIDPYSGSLPWEDSLPGERSIWVEATTAYDPDGFADVALLTAVRQYISYDPVTLLGRPCLGSTDDTLFIRTIVRNPVYFTVRGLAVESTKMLACQTAITSVLDTETRAMRPFILGLDAEVFRNDVMTSAWASKRVQRVVEAFGGYVAGVDVALQPGVLVGSYTMDPGERLKAVVGYE